MSATPPPTDRGWNVAPWERALVAIIGAAAFVGALWFTAICLFVVGMAASDCSGPNSTIQVLETTMFGMAGAAVSSVPWLLTVSLIRVAAGTDWLRWRSWLAVPAVVALIAAPFVAVANATEPPQSVNCQPFSLD